MGIQINGATDSITAIDGTIDVVSAIGNAGVVTATAFVGNITGNVTGNINHTSNLELQTGGVTRAHFNSSGHFNVAGISTFNGNIDVNADLDVDGHTNLDNVSIVGVTTITGGNASVLYLESSNPTIRLTDTDTNVYSTIGGESGNLYLYTNSSSRDFIFRGSNEVARLTGDGYFGIGVNATNPGYNIVSHIGSNTAYSGSATNNTALAIGNVNSSANTNSVGIYMYSDGNGRGVVGLNCLSNSTGSSADFTIQTRHSGTLGERLRITSDGTIGINETSPTSVLHVKHHNNNSADITIEGGGSGNAGLKFIPGGQTNTYFAYVDTNRNFRIQDHTAERLRIVAGGKVLIGNGTYYTPQGMLHIVGDDNSNGPELYLQVGNNNTVDNIGALVFGNNVDKSICMIRGSTHTANNTGDIEFHTSTTGSMTEKLRIASNGDIGLGTVPETDSYQPSLYFAGGNANIWGSGNANLYTAVNTRYTGAGGWKYNNNGVASYVGQQSGVWSFHNAPSGTADNVATFFERFRINSDGEVRLHSANGNNSDTPGITFRGGNSTQKANFARIHSRMVSGWGGQLQFKVKNDTGSLADAYQTAMIMDHNAVIRTPNQCGFHMIHDGNQSLSSGDMITNWDTDASAGKSYIKNCSFNSGRFVAPVDGLYFFTAQMLLMQVGNNDDSIHIIWTTGSSNTFFSYWNTRHEGEAANSNGYGYQGYLPVTGSTTAYLSEGDIFGIKASFSGSISVYGTDTNWGHWSGYLVG